MQYYQQLGVNDCGPACLAMVSSHYKLYISTAEIRKLCKTDSMGTNFAGLITAAEKLGFTTQALKGDISATTLDSKLIFPFIAHIKITYLGSPYDHFVVIKTISKTKVEIWDPNPAENKHTISREEFLKIWTGYVLFLSPNTHFVPKKEKSIPLFKYFPLLLPHKKSLVITFIASVLLVVFGILISFYYKYIIDEIVITRALFTLVSLSIGVLLIVVVQAVVEVLREIIMNYVVYKTDIQFSFSYINHLLKLPVSFFDSRRTGEILSRLDDITTIREVLSGTTLSVIMDTLLLVISAPFLFRISGVLFSISLLSILIVSIIVRFFIKIYRRQYTLLRHEEAGLFSTVVEILNGAYTIKALNAEQRARNDYEKNLMKVTWTSWKTNRIQILQGFLTGIVTSVAGIITFWVASTGIINDTFSFGTLLSFNALLAYFSGPLFRLINLQAGLQEAFVAAERVSEILETEPEQSEDVQLIKPPALEGDIEFNKISFKYGMRQPLYTDFSFRINKGQWAAFVGPSGCGKTTLVKLLLKFYAPEQGTVFIDGNDLRSIDATALRSHIGYVPQNIYLFSGAVSENIALNNPAASMEDIVAAAEKAGADEFINRLPERYNTKLGERGATLSGGEQQRLALARALLGNPDILILDEATSNLDSISEYHIFKTLETFRGSMTVIIIAHRLSTVQKCDVIFVMDKGAIVESGSHKRLLANKGLYKTLWESTVL